MAKLNPLTLLAGLKAPRTPNAVSKTRRLAVGTVPGQEANLGKTRGLLAGVPMSVRGRKPRLGGL